MGTPMGNGKMCEKHYCHSACESGLGGVRSMMTNGAVNQTRCVARDHSSDNPVALRLTFCAIYAVYEAHLAAG